MPPKRKRNVSVPSKGLRPGEKLKRASASTPWGWVGSEVTEVEQITLEHRLMACNLSCRNSSVLCSNKYSPAKVRGSLSPKPMPLVSITNGELEDDIIVISDDEDEEPSCSKKSCKMNPKCLNYLGQDVWETDEEMLTKYAKLGRDPSQYSREQALPVGLKNLGATCYANASLQVWYRDLAFRSGVFSCEPPEGASEEKYRDSPIFQLQVTFAALQEGNKTSFNPKRLVESLQLRTSEQQDAQEFSKLFMSHLDTEFKKQTSTAVKSLVTDQFQGSQVYGTICHSCKNRSEKASDFLEIEISFETNSKLEDRLAASLLPETLSGDNKYFCSRCGSLQDATRYTELRQLPPVLHFSLLRFVYDISTMERKKSKHSISFPLVLDMHKFIGSKNVRQAAMSMDSEDDLYELRGILLHKGTSAYHGHYEAQVNDIEYGSWFQFNDETVTKIKTLGDKVSVRRSTNENAEDDDILDPSKARKQRMNTNARKRRRIDDSDDDITEVKCKTSTSVSPTPVEKPSLITSKDAYMLIYARKSNTKDPVYSEASSSASTPLKPPARAMDVVRDFNAIHDKACKDFKEREQRIKSQFRDLQHKVQDVYLNWEVKDVNEDSIVVSRQALEAWISEHCVEALLHQDVDMDLLSEPASPSCSMSDKPPSTTISVSDVVCEHGYLDPMKSRDMKCISSRTLDKIIKTTSCTFEPILRTSDACSVCVADIFHEKLYEIKHPRFTKRFEEISPVLSDDEVGYWVSKKWTKDWRLIKPRMHTATRPDPAPDSSEFYSHVNCEHGGLSLNTTNRRKISLEAVTLLQELFPSWKPLASNAETCVICDAEVHISKEDKKEVRRRVEDEKARLKFIHQPSLESWAKNGTEIIPCAVIPSQFIRNWKRWVNNPFDHPRPNAVDNTPFLCEHDLLAFDPNCFSDLDSTITIIERDQWDVLQLMYDNSGPLIALTRQSDLSGGGYDHEILVCEECRMKRKTEWESADIIIRLCVGGGGGPEPEPEGGPAAAVTQSQQRPATYGGRRAANGSRQSKRLRQIKEHGERRRITVSKSTTVKDIKIMASEEFTIPTICQRLFHQGRELDDNSATVAALQLAMHDVLDLREVDEVLQIDSDSDERPAPKKRREEGPGFGGTLLGSTTDSPWSSSPERTPPQTNDSADEKPCLKCTFSNTLHALVCEMCNTIF